MISFTEDAIRKITASTTAPASLLPTSGEVAGWTYDQTPGSYTMNGPVTANNSIDATNYIDGAADPIFDPTRTYQPVALSWEVYTNGSATTPQQMDAKIVQMASSGDAGKLFNDVLTFSQYAPLPSGNIPWTRVTGSDPTPCGTL